MKALIRQLVDRLIKNAVFFYYKRIHQKYLLHTSEFFTQYVRNRITNIGSDVYVNGKIHISDLKNICIGNNVHIGNNCYFYTRGGLLIGDNTHISRNVTIYTANHNYSGSKLPYDDTYKQKPVIIGKNVWIGMNVSIAPGITIGDGAIIGLGAIVTQHIPAMAIVGASPVTHLKDRDVDIYSRLEKAASYGGRSGKKIPDEQKAKFRVSARQKKGDLFFVVSTGRSGTNSFAQNFSKHQEICCLHEPKKQLTRLSTEYAHGIKSDDQVKAELEALYVKCSTIENTLKIYGESDQKNSNLIFPLHELLPEAKFIWLIRNPYDFVASAYGRGWFDDYEYGANKLSPDTAVTADVFNPYRWETSMFRINGHKCGAFTDSQWKEMTAFERVCWYWDYWNSLIEKQLMQIPDKQWMLIRLEDFAKEQCRVFDFLDVKRADISIGVYNKVKHKRIYKEEWSETQKACFDKWCGKGLKKWIA